MDLPYSQFHADAIKIIQDIADSHFVAFDLEFTGVARSAQRNVSGKPSLQEHYHESKLAAAKYQILQFGLTTVKEDLENGRYILKPYNFNISPLPIFNERTFRRDWSMSSGAVQFLLQNKFDLGRPFSHGIPYLSRAEEIQSRLILDGVEDRKRPDMILKTEDEKLISHIRNSIITWLEQPEEDRESYLNIPNDDRGKGVPGVLNRYQVRLVHQIVQNDYPQFKTRSMRDFVQITNPSEQERERMKTLRKEHVDREVGRAVGFRWILEAMVGKDISGMPDECFLSAVSQFDVAREGLTPFQGFVFDLNEKLRKRRRVLVGHNCLTDLIYLHQFFLGELPDRVEDFQDSIHELFPAVIDTKYLASVGSRRWGDTSLTSVEMELRDGNSPEIFVPPEFDRYISDEKPHEAGYDAMLTANIAIKLSTKLDQEREQLEKEAQKEEIPNEPTSSEPFGAKEDGYETAPEDTGSQSSKPRSTEETDGNAVATTNQGSASIISSDLQSPTASSDASNVVAVKDKKPKPINWDSTAEVEKVRGAFAATNIYDILDDNTDTNKAEAEEDLMSFSDLDSPTQATTKTTISREEINAMVKEGKIMPRWDARNGFWQVFGNKLQVNSCKEGVCNL